MAVMSIAYTVKLGDKERFDKEKIGVQEPYSRDLFFQFNS